MANKLPEMLVVHPDDAVQPGTVDHAYAYEESGLRQFEGRAEVVCEAVRRWNAHEALVEMVHRAFHEGHRYGLAGDTEDDDGTGVRAWNKSTTRSALAILDAAKCGAE